MTKTQEVKQSNKTSIICHFLTLLLFFDSRLSGKNFSGTSSAVLIYILVVSHAYSHARACHKGGRGFERRRGGDKGVIRGIATSAANQTAIARRARRGEEGGGAEGDRPNADKARAREREIKERRKE